MKKPLAEASGFFNAVYFVNDVASLMLFGKHHIIAAIGRNIISESLHHFVLSTVGGCYEKVIAILITFVLAASFSGCSSFYPYIMGDVGSTVYVQKFYDKVNESKILLDLVATDVCAAWKDATDDFNLSTKDVNDAIENAKQKHSQDIEKIEILDKEICDLFDEVKNEKMDFSAEFALKQVMTAYSDYRDSVVDANDALDSRGYLGISASKDSLDRALRDLFVEL